MAFDAPSRSYCEAGRICVQIRGTSSNFQAVAFFIRSLNPALCGGSFFAAKVDNQLVYKPSSSTGIMLSTMHKNPPRVSRSSSPNPFGTKFRSLFAVREIPPDNAAGFNWGFLGGYSAYGRKWPKFRPELCVFAIHHPFGVRGSAPIGYDASGTARYACHARASAR